MQGILKALWGNRGERRTQPKQMEYEWTYVFGGACPETGQTFALILPEANTEMMNLFLEKFSKEIAPDVHVVLIVDNAAWHSSKTLRIPENITLHYLPPYSPELNPIERVWKELKTWAVANRVFDTMDDLIEAICKGWNRLSQDKDKMTTLLNTSYINAI